MIHVTPPPSPDAIRPSQVCIHLSAEEKARKAVAQALYNPKVTCRYRIRKVVGFGNNSAVCEALDLRHIPPLLVALKIVYRNQSILVSQAHQLQPLQLYCPESMQYRSIPVSTYSHSLGGWAYAHRLFLNKTEGLSTLPHNIVKVVFRECVESLQALHSLGYYHGNISTESFVVRAGDEGPVIRLVGFGHSKPIKQGVSRYFCEEASPPELLPGSPFLCSELDGRAADVFAMGMMLFGLLNDGEPPLMAREHAGLLGYDDFMSIDGGKYPFDPVEEVVVEEDADLQDLLDGMCFVDPVKRIPLQHVLVHRFFLL
ncbi:kinase-like domain-containing protein [Obelidium mucronatum]|nr:kinase-like domain-containing protein [Obelidium mucronatum]